MVIALILFLFPKSIFVSVVLIFSTWSATKSVGNVVSVEPIEISADSEEINFGCDEPTAWRILRSYSWGPARRGPNVFSAANLDTVWVRSREFIGMKFR